MNVAQSELVTARWAPLLQANGIGDATMAKNVSASGGSLLLHSVHAYRTSQLNLTVVVKALVGRCLSHLENIRKGNSIPLFT